MDEIKTVAVPVTTIGAAGSAAGSGVSPHLHGLLLDIRMVFHASAPATLDTTVAYGAYNDNEGNTIPTFGDILVLTNVNTTALYAPRQDTHDDAGAVQAAGSDYFPLNGPLTVSLAQGDALTNCAIAYIRYMKS